MSSIMRRRSGLMGFSLIGSSCLEVGVLDPSILKTERPPVTCARSKSYCGRRNRPTAPPAPSRGSGFVLVPQAEVDPRLLLDLANDVRCTREQGFGNWQTKALRRLNVDHQVELIGLLDGQVAGVGALQDTGDKRGGASVQQGAVWSVSQNSSSLSHMHVRRDHGNSIFK